jgi:hypothetical protein
MASSPEWKHVPAMATNTMMVSGGKMVRITFGEQVGKSTTTYHMAVQMEPALAVKLATDLLKMAKGTIKPTRVLN